MAFWDKWLNKQEEIAPSKNPPFVLFPLPKITDQSPDEDQDLPDMPKVGEIRPIRNPGLIYRTEGTSARGSFRPAEYNLSDIGRLADVDSYVRQSFSKKIGLMFKEGFELVGHNKLYVTYIKKRLQQIADASGLSTVELLRAMGADLIKVSNAFIAKVRKVDASGGKIRKLAGGQRELQPVAGYFPLPAETIEVDVDEHGVVRQWRQNMPDGNQKIFPKDNILHLYFDRKQGFVMGTPTLVPVIDDVMALRKIEENVEILIHQYIFPIFQYIVGTEEKPAGTMPDGTPEVKYVEQQISYMASEGGIVTPERHEIKMLGAQGRALRAEQYLEHFKKRVFSGLGCSSVDFGEGGTANRSTASTMSQNLVDSVKDFQRVFEDLFNNLVIKELMLESTFNPNTLFDEENLVKLRFKEIDLEAQIKRENHNADVFLKNGITYREYREALGKEPILIPSADEVATGDMEALHQQFPDWYETAWKLFDEPKLLIQSVDEPFSAESKAASRNKSLDITPTDLDEEEQARSDELEQEGEIQRKTSIAKAKLGKRPTNRSATTNQHGTTLGKRKSSFNYKWQVYLADNVLLQPFEQFQKYAESDDPSASIEWLSSIGQTLILRMSRDLLSETRRSFLRGYLEILDMPELAGEATSRYHDHLAKRATDYTTSIINNVLAALRRYQIDNMLSADKLTAVRTIFDALKFRIHFIWDVETRKAYNFGKVLALRQQGFSTIKMLSNNNDGSSCKKCSQHHGILVNTLDISLDTVLPHHPNCNCNFNIVIKNNTTEDSGENTQAEMLERGEIVNCPECGNNLTMNQSGVFFCKKCRKSVLPNTNEQNTDN